MLRMTTEGRQQPSMNKHISFTSFVFKVIKWDRYRHGVCTR